MDSSGQIDDLAQIIMNCPAVPVCFAKDMLVSSSKSSSYIVTNIVYLSSKKGVDNEEIEGSEKKPVETESSPKIDIEKTSFDSDDSVAIGSKKNNAEDL